MPLIRVGLRPHPFTFLFLAAFVGGCVSQPPGPTVSIEQTSSVAAIRVGTPSGGLPVDYRLEVTNPLDNPVTLTAVEIETVGLSGGYMMNRVRHKFAQVIPPHGTTSIDLRAWVYPLQQTDSGQVASPVMLRGIAKFDSMGTTIRRAFAGRLGK